APDPVPHRRPPGVGAVPGERAGDLAGRGRRGCGLGVGSPALLRPTRNLRPPSRFRSSSRSVSRKALPGPGGRRPDARRPDRAASAARGGPHPRRELLRRRHPEGQDRLRTVLAAERVRLTAARRLAAVLLVLAANACRQPAVRTRPAVGEPTPAPPP